MKTLGKHALLCSISKEERKSNKITNNISYNKHCCAISYTCVNKEGDSKKNANKTIKVLLVF